MEKVAYTMGKRYADIMKTMWFTFMYSPAIPIAPLFSMIGLCVYYWADKYNAIIWISQIANSHPDWKCAK